MQCLLTLNGSQEVEDHLFTDIVDNQRETQKARFITFTKLTLHENKIYSNVDVWMTCCLILR